MRALDVLSQRPYVDRKRLAVIGLSYGGTMATHLLVNDRRLKCGVVSGYISTIRGDALLERGRGNTCGAQHVRTSSYTLTFPMCWGWLCRSPSCSRWERRRPVSTSAICTGRNCT